LPSIHTKIKVFWYVDAKCESSTHPYYPKTKNWSNKVLKRYISCIHTKLQHLFHKQMVYYNNFIHVRNISFCSTRIWSLYNTTKMPIMFIYAWKYFNIFMMCSFHTTRLQFLNFIITHLTLPYIVSYSKNCVQESIFGTFKQGTYSTLFNTPLVRY
jgi:hypothetical protein